MDRETVAVKVISHIREISPPSRRSGITQETEIYYDLGIYGDDFVYEIVSWVQGQFGVIVDPPVNMEEFVPGERNFPCLWNTAKKRARQRQRQKYRTLRVRDLVDAIVAGRWETN